MINVQALSKEFSDPKRGFDVVREQIGFLSGDMGLYGRLTPGLCGE